MRHLVGSVGLLLLLLVLCVGGAYAFDLDGYTTPDSWSQQVTPGQFKQSVTGIGLTKDTKMYISLTTRYRLRSDELADDQDIYQYFRVTTDGVKLGSGTVKGTMFMRLARDIDGDNQKDWSNDYYYSQRDILDAEDSGWAERLYQGYLQFDNVIKNTNVNIGRFYLEHLDTFQLDGADVSYKINDMISVYGFGGKPVSYFEDRNAEDKILGAGTSIRYHNTKLEGEYAYIKTEGIDDDYGKVKVTQLIDGGFVDVMYTNLSGSNTINGDVDYEFKKTGTIVTFGYEGVTDTIDSNKTYVVNPITYALLPEKKYNKFSASAYQALLKYFVAGVNVETKDVRGSGDFDNRDYMKYGFKFDINGLPHKDTYISFNLDKWDVDNPGKDDHRLQLGLQVNQKVTDAVNVWAGTSYGRFKYDYLTDRRKDDVRDYYVGGEYQATKNLSFMVDFTREVADFYENVDSKLDKNYMIELWANIIF